MTSKWFVTQSNHPPSPGPALVTRYPPTVTRPRDLPYSPSLPLTFILPHLSHFTSPPSSRTVAHTYPIHLTILPSPYSHTHFLSSFLPRLSSIHSITSPFISSFCSLPYHILSSTTHLPSFSISPSSPFLFSGSHKPDLPQTPTKRTKQYLENRKYLKNTIKKGQPDRKWL